MSSVTTEDLRARPAEAPAPSPAPTVPNNHVIVLFGATGDLARRKLLPGMFRLAEAGLMPERFIVIGAARSEMEDGEFVALAREAVDKSGHSPVAEDAWNQFAASLRFTSTGG